MHPAFRDHVPGFADWFADLGRSQVDDSAVGDTFWMPLRADARPHGVVVVVAAGGPATFEDKAAIATRAAIDEAVRRLRDEVGLEGRLLVALPAFRIGMGGDRDQQLRSARAQITSAREALTRHAGVDVTFLSYTPAIYRVFLEARRLEPGTPSPGPAIPPDLERSLIDGECVLFVGAGLSRGAGLPDWGELVARMAEELGLATHEGLDYLDLAQWYREKLGDDAPGRLVAATFADPDPPPKPTLAHYLAMSLPASFVITTNYDDLLERTLSAQKRHPVTVVDQAEVAGTGGADGVHVVKLHGDASRPDHIVLSRDDYDRFFERRPAMALLLEGLMLNRTFLFLGYGLRDPNFRQVFGRVGRMLREAQRPAFATSFESAGQAGAFIAEQWRLKGLDLVAVPGESDEDRGRNLLLFLDRLADRVASGTPRLLLAPDALVSGPMARLRGLLLEAGEEVIGLCRGADPASPEIAVSGPIADVLKLLADQGWRPAAGSRTTLCRLWERLADLVADSTKRRRLLVEALRAAEGADEARRVRTVLADLEGRGKRSGGQTRGTE